MKMAHYRALLAQQWKYQYREVLAAVILSGMIAPFALFTDRSLASGFDVRHLLVVSAVIGTIASVIAIGLGLLLAIRPFILDAQTKHTYALSLPIRRSDYALMRAGAGLTLAALPTVSFFIGSLIASQILPSTLFIHAYPFSLSARFLLATICAFGVAYGVQYGLGRTAGRWVAIVFLTVVVTEIFSQVAFRQSALGLASSVIFTDGGPFSIFTTRWMLFDV